MKCLVVDDSRVVRKVIQRITRDMGFTCIEAEDGQEAYMLCQESMPDVIILDWNMPVMSGMEFLEKLRAMDGGAHAKVFMCTTENDISYMTRALEAGADEYIMKPFDGDIIASKFKQVGLRI